MTINIITHKASDTLRKVMGTLEGVQYDFVGYRRGTSCQEFTFNKFMGLMSSTILLAKGDEDYVNVEDLLTKKGLKKLNEELQNAYNKELDFCTHREVYEILSKDFAGYMTSCIVHDTERGLVVVGLHEDLESFAYSNKEERRNKRRAEMARIQKELGQEVEEDE